TMDKVEIAKKYLLPRQIEENGIPPKLLKISDDAHRHIIRRYTREAGVRELERKYGSIARKVARRIAAGNRRPVAIGERNLSQFLGPGEYRSGIARKRPTVGVGTGLAKTFDGGEILFIESVKMKGGGRLRLTGQLGDVMRESAEAAMSFVQSHYLAGAPDKQFFEHYDIHIHVPAGAGPKDGPRRARAVS